MVEKDLILDASNIPIYDEIFDYINEPARDLWRDVNSFIQQEYKVFPKITYSKCSAASFPLRVIPIKITRRSSG